MRIIPDSDNPERFAEGSVVHARPARTRLAGAGLAGATHGSPSPRSRGEPEFPIVAFAGVGSREAAEGLRGFILEVPGDELPDSGRR